MIAASLNGWVDLTKAVKKPRVANAALGKPSRPSRKGGGKRSPFRGTGPEKMRF